MVTSLTSLDDHTGHVVAGRHKTKEARFLPLPSDVERIEDVLQQALGYLHEHLKSLGFKSVPSQLALKRKLGEFTQVIDLRKGSANLSGVSVEVSAHVTLKSSSLKRWTESEGTKYGRDFVWGRQLGYLSDASDYLTWQLVDRETREKELSDLLAKIQALALPAFDAWSNKSAIGTAVFRRTEAERIDWLVETALWSCNRDAAARLVQQYLQSHTEEVAMYAHELARFRADRTIGKPLSHPISGIAFLVAHHTLEVERVG
ncbi:MAG: hypothetical protein V4858_02210 [Pseudomonadota bacterium]